MRVGPAGGQIVGYEHRFTVRGAGRSDRLSGNRDSRQFATHCQVNQGNIVVEAITNVQSLSIRGDGSSRGGMPHGDRFGHPTCPQIDDGYRALRRRTGNDQLHPVRTQDQAGRFGWYVKLASDLSRR